MDNTRSQADYSDPMQPKLKEYLNNAFGEAVFFSMRSPIASTEDYLSVLRQTITNEKAFNSANWVAFQTLGKIDFKGFRTCVNILEDETSDGTLPQLQPHMVVATVIVDHIVNVQTTLDRMRKEPYNRNLNWLYGKDISDDEGIDRRKHFNLYVEQELERLKSKRYHFRSVNPGVKSEDFIQSEIARFEKLFEPDHYDFEWTELHDYPEDPLASGMDLKELYIAVQDCSKGRFMEAIMSPYKGRQRLMAKAQAIEEYIKFLRAELGPVADVQPSDKTPDDNEVSAHDFKFEPGDNLTLKAHGAYGEGIRQLFDVLKSLGIMPGNTKFNPFLKIFTDKPLVRPLIWKGTQYELHYFVKIISPYLKESTQGDYGRAAKLFVPKLGKAFGNLDHPGGNSKLPPQRAEAFTKAMVRFVGILKK